VDLCDISKVCEEDEQSASSLGFLRAAVKHLSSTDFFECYSRCKLIKQIATRNKSFSLTRVFV